jgi:hypothetical protein
LEQYQNRLHGSSDNYEELDYIKQILASSFFQQYGDKAGGEGGATSLPHHNNEIAQAVSILETSNLDESHISPAEKRKINLHRKESLKALRNAVVLKNSMSGSSLEKGGPGVGVGAHKQPPLEVGLGARGLPPKAPTAMAPLVPRDSSSFLEQSPSHVTTAIPIARPVNGSTDRPPSLDASTAYQVAENPTTAKSHGFERHQPESSKSSNLSNSSSLMLEAGFLPPSGPGDIARGFESISGGSSGSLGDSRARHKSSITGSQPNISMLRITQQGGLEFGDHEDPILGMGSGDNPLEWVESHSVGKKLTLSPISPPSARPPPPSYTTHMQNHTLNPTPSLDRNTTRIPPVYGGGMDARRRAKSYEKLLDTTDGGSFTPYSKPSLPPLVQPMTDGVTTRDVLTTEQRRTSLAVRLNKGKAGLGFRLKGLKKEQIGGLYIQDMQHDGPAAR